MTAIQAGKKSNEKEVYSIHRDKRRKLNPNHKLGQLVHTTDIKKVFSKGDSTNYSLNYKQKLKSYTTPSLAVEITAYLRDIIKTYYYQQNYLLMKTIKL